MESFLQGILKNEDENGLREGTSLFFSFLFFFKFEYQERLECLNGYASAHLEVIRNM